ncbi:MAG: hypothetical protein M3452_10325 [Chloroflexota bacterium]|nr:hypothetical protein [Chloroflexota bacterium]
MRVPAFVVRRFYVAGSLRNTPTGFQMQAHNEMGDGTLVGVTRISVDGMAMDPRGITAQREGTDEVVRSSDISRTSPVPFRRGERVTLHVESQTLTPGAHELEVELVELNLGALQLGISESVAPDAALAPDAAGLAGSSDGDEGTARREGDPR